MMCKLYQVLEVNYSESVELVSKVSVAVISASVIVLNILTDSPLKGKRKSRHMYFEVFLPYSSAEKRHLNKLMAAFITLRNKQQTECSA